MKVIKYLCFCPTSILFSVLFSLMQPAAASAQSVFLLQIGSYDNEMEATKRWELVRNQNQDILQGLSLRVSEVSLPPDNYTIYRTQIGPLEYKSEASSLCKQLKERDVECFVVETAMYSATPPQRANRMDAGVVELVANEDDTPSLQEDDYAPVIVPEPPAPEDAAKEMQIEEDIIDLPEKEPVVTAAETENIDEIAKANLIGAESAAEENKNKTVILPWLAGGTGKVTEGAEETEGAAGGKGYRQEEDSRQKAPAATETAAAMPVNGSDDAAKSSNGKGGIVSKKYLVEEVEEKGKKEVPAAAGTDGKEEKAGLFSLLPWLMGKEDESSPIDKISSDVKKRTLSTESGKRHHYSQMPESRMPKQILPPAALAGSSENTADTGVKTRVSVAEAIRVPLSQEGGSDNVGDNVKAEEGANPKTVFRPRALGRGAYPSQSFHQRTLWAQLGYFSSKREAMNHWNAMRYDFPGYFDGVRGRIIQPLHSRYGSGKISLRIGPFLTMEEVREICALPLSAELKCSVVKDIGSSTAANQPRYRPYARVGKILRPRHAAYGKSVFWVQLGSYASPGQASRAWDKVKTGNKDILGHLQPDIYSPTRSSAPRSIFRLRTGPYVNRGLAKELCDKLLWRGVDCLVIAGG